MTLRSFRQSGRLRSFTRSWIAVRIQPTRYIIRCPAGIGAFEAGENAGSGIAVIVLRDVGDQFLRLPIGQRNVFAVIRSALRD